VLTVFVVKRVLGGSIDKGTSQILYSVAKKASIVPKQMYAQIITSFTVGLGGSAGLESPIVAVAWIKLCAALQTELQGQDSLVVESLPEAGMRFTRCDLLLNLLVDVSIAILPIMIASNVPGL
jgi:CIC family chloride channel protein